jgi:Acetyltransferase (GNAT) domain
VTLTDGVVALRPRTEDDIPAITEACQDPEIARWTPVPSPYTEDDPREFLRAAPDAQAIVDARTASSSARSAGAGSTPTCRSTEPENVAS